ncbi:MAG TPA: hypothetical protein VLH35_06460 [Candidatus Acidoferrales bacterium]|nr:hypothetical protein [Candidatus Acidoferrales bacterium]
MGLISKKFTLILILLLAASSLTVVSSVSGQSLKPVVTEFSLQYVDNSYDVPPSYKYTKDLYTGETITTTIPGYRVDNKSLVATIKNPTGVNAYNFRWKSHDDSSWHYHPFDTEVDQTPPLSASGAGGPPAYASDSEYTVISILSLNHLSSTSLEVQVQALYGEYHAVSNTPIQLFEGDYYDYYFDGQASYWSNTQTVTISDEPATQNPTTPPTLTPTVSSFPTTTPTATSTENPSGFDLMQTAVVVLAVVVAILLAVIILVFRNYRKSK